LKNLATPDLLGKRTLLFEDYTSVGLKIIESLPNTTNAVTFITASLILPDHVQVSRGSTDRVHSGLAISHLVVQPGNVFPATTIFFPKAGQAFQNKSAYLKCNLNSAFPWFEDKSYIALLRANITSILSILLCQLQEVFVKYLRLRLTSQPL